MFRVSLDLGRTPHVAFHQHGLRVTREWNGAGEEERPAGDDVLGLSHVRDDLLRGLLRARADAGERQRGAHQLEKLPASLRVVPLRGLLGEFAVKVLTEFRGVGEFAEAAPVQTPFGAGQAGTNGSKIHVC